MKYRKKPVVVEAYQTDKELDIETLEGTMHASAGDYIITGVRGEQYPCKPDIFEQTYEPADAPTASPWHRVEDELPKKILHIPNGGYRTPSEAAHFKRLGVKAGVPDLLLPYPVGDHHGLWIELKSLSGKPSQAQKEWILWLREQGYCAYICRGADAAIRCIEMYLRCET